MKSVSKVLWFEMFSGCQDPNASSLLRGVYTQQMEEQQQLVQQMRTSSNLSQLQRAVLLTLTLQGIHHRDVIAELLSKNVQSPAE